MATSDERLIEFVRAVEEYSVARRRLNDVLKKGYFLCTVAKHEQPWAPSGAAMTNAMLQPKHAFRVVTSRHGAGRRWEAAEVGSGDAESASGGEVQGVAEAQAEVEPRPPGLARRGAAVAGAPPHGEGQTEASASAGPARAGAASPSSSTSSTSSGTLQDPALLFGPMPPPSLRKAQRSLSPLAPLIAELATAADRMASAEEALQEEDLREVKRKHAPGAADAPPAPEPSECVEFA